MIHSYKKNIEDQNGTLHGYSEIHDEESGLVL